MQYVAGASLIESDTTAHAAAGVQSAPDSPMVLALDGHASLHGARNMQGAWDRYAQALSLDPEHSLSLLFRSELMAMQGRGRLARLTRPRQPGPGAGAAALHVRRRRRTGGPG